LPAELLDHLVLAVNNAVIERAMGAEMSLHLGDKAGDARSPEQANERSGASGETIHTFDLADQPECWRGISTV
jgi:hypothetical protein